MSFSNVRRRQRAWRALLRENPGVNCHWCGIVCSGKDNELDAPTIDHLLAQVLGGKNNIENLVISCRKCNNSKSLAEEKLAIKLKIHVNANINGRMK